MGQLGPPLMGTTMSMTMAVVIFFNIIISTTVEAAAMMTAPQRWESQVKAETLKKLKKEEQVEIVYRCPLQNGNLLDVDLFVANEDECEYLSSFIKDRNTMGLIYEAAMNDCHL